jgi:hypothetical protein
MKNKQIDGQITRIFLFLGKELWTAIRAGCVPDSTLFILVVLLLPTLCTYGAGLFLEKSILLSLSF